MIAICSFACSEMNDDGCSVNAKAAPPGGRAATAGGGVVKSAMPDIVLHEWAISPFCGKVRKVLAFKGLPYRIEDYGGFRALKARGLSRSGKLPVLDYD